MLRVTETMLKRDQIYLSATQKDSAAALSLMEGLERFEVPRTLEVIEGMEPMARRRRVMRHGQENPRVTELPSLVTEKLGESAVMVLICSSSSSTSRWIRAELEEFYRTHPRGPIIPVVLDGEPNPDQSRQAFEKPCFPENLKKADIDRWVDGRGTDWAETAPVAALATILGVRVEQLIHHEAILSRRMRKQRSLAFWAMVASVVLTLGWTLRWPLHGLAKELTIYSDRWAPTVEKWLESTEFRGHFSGLERLANPPGAAEASPATASSKPVEVSPPKSQAKPAQDASFLGTLPKADPVAYQLAVNAWLDEAEKYLPEQLAQAERWIQKAKEGLEKGDGLDFGNELYRAHALAAVVAQRRKNSEQSRQELLKAVQHWTSIPIQDLDKREEEGFSILTTIAPTQEWRESAIKMISWLAALPGNEVKVSQRAGRLIDLIEVHAFLAEPVEKWLATAASLMQPQPEDAVATKAKFAMLRANLLRSRKNQDGALAALDEGERALTASAKPDSGLHRALAAQFRYRKGEYSGAAIAAPDLEKNLNQIQEGQTVQGWDGWFGADLRAGWRRLGDVQLHQDAYAESIAAYNRALEFTKNPEELAAILLKTGCAYRYQGDAAGSWDAFSLAIPIFEEAKNDASLLTALWGGVLAARDLKRPKEGSELQERASKLQAKLGSSYQPPEYWRDRIGPVEFSPGGSSGEPVAEKPAVAEATVATSTGKPTPVPAQSAALTPSAPAPSPTAEASAVPISPPGGGSLPKSDPPSPAAGKSDAKKGVPVAGTLSSAELEERIVTLQRKIAKLEADSKNRQTFKGLEELQNLYAELDSLLRRKLTGAPRK